MLPQEYFYITNTNVLILDYELIYMRYKLEHFRMVCKYDKCYEVYWAYPIILILLRANTI